jgi:putative transposase
MDAGEKHLLLKAVQESGLCIRDTLRSLDLPKATYYRWKKKYDQHGTLGLKDKPSVPRCPWNKLLDHEEALVMNTAMKKTDFSPRELAFWITDSQGFSVSESSVYRILKRHGLIPDKQSKTFPASEVYHTQTSMINQQWQTDASYLFVVDWGWWYLICVKDDFSRKIISWILKPTMTAKDFSEAVELAYEKAEIDKYGPQPKLVSDRGPALISDEFNDYLEAKGIYHILASPYHPQTCGKIERFHRSVKEKIKLNVYDLPETLKAELGKFISFYNKRRYHEALDNVTPDDVWYGRKENILEQRLKLKIQTLEKRKFQNKILAIEELKM